MTEKEWPLLQLSGVLPARKQHNATPGLVTMRSNVFNPANKTQALAFPTAKHTGLVVTERQKWD